jgi:hypothetical protein
MMVQLTPEKTKSAVERTSLIRCPWKSYSDRSGQVSSYLLDQEWVSGIGGLTIWPSKASWIGARMSSMLIEGEVLGN